MVLVRRAKSSKATRISRLNSIKRTTQTHVTEMLMVARAIIANPARGLEGTYGIVRIDIMTVSYGAKATLDVVSVLGMISVRPKPVQGTFIWCEMLGRLVLITVLPVIIRKTHVVVQFREETPPWSFPPV